WQNAIAINRATDWERRTREDIGCWRGCESAGVNRHVGSSRCVLRDHKVLNRIASRDTAAKDDCVVDTEAKRTTASGLDELPSGSAAVVSARQLVRLA